MKAYQLRLYPTLRQRRQLEKEFNACRYVRNWALDRRSTAYKQDGESLNAISLSRELTAIKKEKTFLKTASATVLTYVLKSQEEAFQKFFKSRPATRSLNGADGCAHVLSNSISAAGIKC
ncbi:helix-turn-helix domain-containing protein [Nitrosococcus oceani]|uniref:helix-turn-helix domain-containing protein n=1 Tax=Nitrosococcus oceani TaxID=1229 RepID=UPI000183C952|nr:helix-turn-helix domain-containing protein [Nitrosococcus oceani]EDZ68180.1 hypothetical protein NOC27_1507 [Nitrosococcus oceani AFC27]GEM20992.1 hypothetical protein NONS58_24200 [Nitrosococcus oceani]